MAKTYEPGHNNLTNNFTANMWAIGLSNALLASYVVYRLASGREFDPRLVSMGALRVFLVFNLVYVVTSYWFNPDLDIRVNRPGKGSFPFGPILKRLPKIRRNIPGGGLLAGLLGVVLPPFHHALNLLWRIFWTPFGHAFTHRGIVHWPIIGTQLKILYMFFPYWLIGNLLGEQGRWTWVSEAGLSASLFGKGGLYSDFLTGGLLGVGFFAMLVADLCHTGIDYSDSVRNGTRFVPPPFIAPRGFVYRFFHYLRARLF